MSHKIEYHVTYAHAKFEATTSNCLGGDAFKRKKTLFELDVGIKFTHTAAHYLPHHVTYANLKFVIATSNSLAGYAFTEKHYLTLTFGPRSHKMLSRTLYIMLPMHMQRLKLLHPSLGGDAFTRKHIFGLDPVPSTSCDLCTSKV